MRKGTEQTFDFVLYFFFWFWYNRDDNQKFRCCVAVNCAWGRGGMDKERLKITNGGRKRLIYSDFVDKTGLNGLDDTGRTK